MVIQNLQKMGAHPPSVGIVFLVACNSKVDSRDILKIEFLPWQINLGESWICFLGDS